jgi:hypothetical protein
LALAWAFLIIHTIGTGVNIATCLRSDGGTLVRKFVDGVKEAYGNPRWVTPLVGELPRVAGWLPRYTEQITEGNDRRKWGVEDDLFWFSSCPDTAWLATLYAANVVCAMLSAVLVTCRLLLLKLVALPFKQVLLSGGKGYQKIIV